MLLSFTIKNFRSFREGETLSMVAGARQPDHQDHQASIPEDENKVLSVAAGRASFFL
jgi:AAA15 family ATPase/GTPase